MQRRFGEKVKAPATATASRWGPAGRPLPRAEAPKMADGCAATRGAGPIVWAQSPHEARRPGHIGRALRWPSGVASRLGWQLVAPPLGATYPSGMARVVGAWLCSLES